MRDAQLVYPAGAAERDKWILARRPSRASLDPFRPYAFSVEEERAANGDVIPVANIFLTNRECPWRCLMCDLWQNTLAEETPRGAIAAQIDYALNALPPARQVKLYNSGSFFDSRAIPLEDYAPVASGVAAFERVIVESHPALIGDHCLSFRDLLTPRLEVAMGLEIAHPEILSRLNKRMTLRQFEQASKWLRQHAIDLRTFVLVKPPFINDEIEALHWAERSVDFAFNCGASVVSLIPTRAGNGALDALQAAGDFSPPKLSTLEAAAAYGIGLNRGRVFADLWDFARLFPCRVCGPSRLYRLSEMNLQQCILPPVSCSECGALN